MIGFWEKNPGVAASDDKVKVTVYRKTGKALLSIGNYSDATKSVTLKIDWKRLGLREKRARLVAPEIKDTQEAREWPVDGKISVQPRKGWLVYVLDE